MSVPSFEDNLSNDLPTDLESQKKRIRRQALARCQIQEDKDSVSKRIVDRITTQDIYRHARCLMWYVHIRDEVRTRDQLAQALKTGQRIVVPYCLESQLQLFHLESMDELGVGKYSILEPRTDLRDVVAKRIAASEIDLVLVPGVAFDRQGRRLGRGRGYYDRLLKTVRDDAFLVGLAYESQIFPTLPTQVHDISMDQVVTESHVYSAHRQPGHDS